VPSPDESMTEMDTTKEEKKKKRKEERSEMMDRKEGGCLGGDKESVTWRVSDIKAVAFCIELFVVLELGCRGRHACQRRRMGGRRRGEGEGGWDGEGSPSPGRRKATRADRVRQ
jgi:hypothetical protein